MLFSLRIPCFFPGVPPLIYQLRTSHLCALLLQDLSCNELWSTGWGLTSQTHHFPPDTHFTNTPKLPAQHPKEKPSLHEAGHPPPPPPPPPCHDSWGSAVLPRGGFQRSQGQEAVCHPRGTGAPGDTCPQGVALLGLLKDSEGTRPQQHLRGGTGQQGRRWDGTGNAATSSWPHWVLHLHLRGKME